MTDENKHKEETQFALDRNNQRVYIQDVSEENKGLGPGYYCIGCSRTMVAALPKVYKKYFRHHIALKDGEKKCTFSNETYRHFLAKTFLKDINKIKVPSVYKFHHKLKEAPAKLISEAKFIEAFRVSIETYIYENESGELIYDESKLEETNQVGNSKKSLLIKPDAILFNEQNQPILIVEFVATHKPNQEKLLKIKRLGIDAVQVNVPKSSPEEIKDILFTTKNTKWLFNNEESKTEYDALPKSYTGGIPEIDWEQRKLFEETPACRSAQITNLIHRIGEILESESFTRSEQSIRHELQRVEENTDEHRTRLGDLFDEHRDRGVGQHSERRKALSDEQGKFQQKVADLEKRYFAKRSALEEDITATERQIENQRSGSAGISESIEREKKLIGGTRNAIRFIERDIRRIKSEQNKLRRGFDRETAELEQNARRKMASFPAKIGSDERAIESTFGEKIQDEYATIERVRQRTTEVKRDYEEIRRRKSSDIDIYRNDLLERIKRKDYQGTRGFTSQIVFLQKLEHAVMVYNAALESNRRAKEGDSNDT